MASTTDLGKWMITNGGVYNPEAVYEQLTMVMYDNSTYITLKTVQGVTPTDDHANYQLMAKGFDPTALGSVQAKDNSGGLGEVGGTVSAQDLVDWVVDQAATKLLKISDLVSVQTNDATKGVSAALAYSMNQSIIQLNSDLKNIYVGTAADLNIPRAILLRYNADTQNSPYKQGLTQATAGIVLSVDTGLQSYNAQIAISSGNEKFYIRQCGNNTWGKWIEK